MPGDHEPTNRRSRTRAAALAEITEIAGRHLAEDGLDGLSLRSIARELGMVSSGIYRHVASRDELLTLLIIDGYRRLADTVQQAIEDVAAGRRTAFLATTHAVRTVALADPQRHALLYGTPVAGYTAPPEATEQADRLYRALLGPMVASAGGGTNGAGDDGDADTAAIGFDMEILRRLAPGIDAATAAAALDTWAALFGHLSLELFGHLDPTVTDPDAFFDAAMKRHADRLGLTD